MTELVLDPADFKRAEKIDTEQKLTRPSLSYWQDAWMRLKKNKQALTSLLIVIALLIFTLIGPFIWTVSPSEQNLSRPSEIPSIGMDALVIENPGTWQDTILKNKPEAPKAEGLLLPAPERLEPVGTPSEEAVRLQWSYVEGASGYVIYRTLNKPTKPGHLGLPIFEITQGNQVTYEDRYDLEPGMYYYSVVAKNGDESEHFITVGIQVPSTILLEEAKKITPDARPGGVIDLPSHPLGTDQLGRDLLARLIQGAQVSLFIGFFAPVISLFIGILVGGIAGYAGGKVDQWLMRIADFVIALPFLLMMILFKIAFGIQAGESGVFPMLVSMILLSWTISARLTRGQILQLRESEFVQAAQLLGARPLYLILRHLLPNVMGVILVSLTYEIPHAIFTEAFLSFIGMGVVPPTPSWGSLCNDGIQVFMTHPHEFLFPALFISMTVLAFNLLGDGLRDALDPKMRST